MMWNVALQLFICMLWKCNGCISGNYWIRIIRNVHGFSEDSLEMFNHIKHGLQKCNNHCTKSKNRRTCKIDTLYIFFLHFLPFLPFQFFLLSLFLASSVKIQQYANFSWNLAQISAVLPPNIYIEEDTTAMYFTIMVIVLETLVITHFLLSSLSIGDLLTEVKENLDAFYFNAMQ